MGVKYCKRCRVAEHSIGAVFYQGKYYCVKCKGLLEDVGVEEGVVSDGAKDQKEALTLATVQSDYTQTPGAHYTQKEVDDVLGRCEDALKINPNDTEAMLTLAKYYHVHGQAALGQKWLKKAIDIDPDHEEAKRIYSSIFGNQDDLDDRLGEGGHSDLFYLAHRCLEREDYDQAQEILEKIISQDPSYVPARRYMADVYLAKEMYKEAVVQLTYLKTHNPDDYMLDYNIGVACFFGEQYSRALSAFKEAKKQSDDEELNDEIENWIVRIDSLDA